MSWENGRWLVRDLGSCNGTYVNLRRLEPGASTPLALGDRLQFTLQDPWTIESLGPPEPCAILLGSTQHTWGRAHVLELPNPTACELRVRARDDIWVAESAVGIREVNSGDVVTLGDGRWRLLLPARSSSCATSTLRAAIDLRRATVHFVVSCDEESVRVRLEQDGSSVWLPRRSCLYTLLVLARLRLRDKKSSDSTAAENAETEHEGWVFTDELADMLKVSPTKVNVDVHRVRQLLADARVHCADLIVERRADTHQLRVGTPRLVIERA